MISDKDLDGVFKDDSKSDKDKTSSFSLDAMLAVFDPENDKRDRRILYEITKVRLDDTEFRDLDSSDSHESA